jgi:hypothetical protein
MPAKPGFQPARRPTKGTTRRQIAARRVQRDRGPRQMMLQAASSVGRSQLGNRARDSHQTFRRAIWHLEPIDWIMLIAVGVTVLAALGIGLLSGRLSPGRERPETQPTPPSAPLMPMSSPIPRLPTSVPVPIQTPGPRGSSLIAADGARARLRAEPSLNAPIVERMADGSTVTVLSGEQAEGGRTWRQIESPSGKVGWIDASLLRSSGSPPRPPALPTPTG